MSIIKKLVISPICYWSVMSTHVLYKHLMLSYHNPKFYALLFLILIYFKQFFITFKLILSYTIKSCRHNLNHPYLKSTTKNNLIAKRLLAEKTTKSSSLPLYLILHQHILLNLLLYYNCESILSNEKSSLLLHIIRNL